MTTAGGRERTGQWPRLLDELVALPSLPARLALLGRYGRLDEPGLVELLQAAEGLVVDDPRRADVLAEACAGGAVQLGAQGLEARARYLLGELWMLHGRPRRALEEIVGARCLYAELGEELEALRTALGQMAVLTELGRYDEAERAGRDLLDQLDERELADVAPHGEERLRLRALAHQNLGVCHSLRGRYREALDAFTAAERRHRALGSRLDVAKLRHNRAMELLHLGRASEALALLEDAVATFREQRQTLAAARGLYEAGRARLRLGRYEDALAAFEQARGPLEELHTRADRDQLAVATADAYRALNLYDEALATYRTAEPSLRAAGNAHQLALALLGRGATLVATARLDEAEPVLAEAASLFAAADNLPLHATVLLERSAVADRRGDRQQALRLAWQAHDRVTGTEWTVEQVYGHLRLADLLLSSPRLSEEHLESAAALVRGLPLPHLRYQVDVRLGRLRHLLGRGAEARELLYRAVGVAEELRSALPSQTLRASFQRDKAAAYDHLVALELDELTASGRVQAFRWSERSRSRALADARAAVGAGRATDAAADHGGRIGQLRADLAAAHDALLSPALDAPDPHGARTVSLRRATELEHELRIEQLRAAAPAARPDRECGADALPLIETLDARGVASRLPADTTLLAYHALGDELVAFLVRGGAASHEPEVVRGVGSLARVQALLARLDAQWQRLHADAHFSLDQRERLRGATERLLNGLYTQLLARLEPRLPLGDPAHPDHPSRLVVVPGAAGLQRVPFAALHDGHAPLVDRAEVSLAPSAGVLCDALERRAVDTDRQGHSLVLGVPDARTPSLVAEAREVAARLGDATLLLGDTATVDALRRHTPGAHTVHLACHGVFRQDNPMFSALRLADGWLTGIDALDLPVRDALVTLSACESGRTVTEGGEISGLVGAFLQAGASSVLVSLWLADDDATAALMRRVYDLLADGAGRAAALRLAQRELAATAPHPWYWAPFTLVGSPR